MKHTMPEPPIHGLLTTKELVATFDKESRPCYCWYDPRLRDKHRDDPTIELSVLLARNKYGDMVTLIRAERPCGLVMFVNPEEYSMDPAKVASFWYLLHRRVEKQCDSLYHYSPEEWAQATHAKTPKADRRQETKQRRQKR